MEQAFRINYGMLAFGFLVSVAYIPAIIGAAVPTGYFVLMLLGSIGLFFYDIRITRSHLYGTLFCLYSILSLSWTTRFNIGFFILLQIISFACVFCLGSALRELKSSFIGLALGLTISTLIALYQKTIDFNIIYNVSTQGYPTGLFVNASMYCEVSAILFVSLIILKMYWWLPITIPGIVLVHSRAAIVGLIGTGFMWIWNKNRLNALIILGASITLLFGYYMNYRFDMNSVNERLAIWSDTIRGITLFGHGVGSYEITFPAYAQEIDVINTKPRYAHNDLLQLVFEFGIGTLLLIPLIWNIIKSKNDVKYILCCIGAISLFSFPFHVPMSIFIGLLVAGYITRFDDCYVFVGNRSRSVFFTGIEAK